MVEPVHPAEFSRATCRAAFSTPRILQEALREASTSRASCPSSQAIRYGRAVMVTLVVNENHPPRPLVSDSPSMSGLTSTDIGAPRDGADRRIRAVAISPIGRASSRRDDIPAIRKARRTGATGRRRRLICNPARELVSGTVGLAPGVDRAFQRVKCRRQPAGRPNRDRRRRLRVAGIVAERFAHTASRRLR